MDPQATSSREYRDFEPTTSIIQEEECDTIFFSLPGFRKDQLRVQLTPTRALEISGERHTGDNKWIRFQKTYPVSPNSDTSKITAKFEFKDGVGILYIRQPKLIKPDVKKDEEKTENEAQNSEKNDAQPPLTQKTQMENASKQMDKNRSREKMEDEDKVVSKTDNADDEYLAQKTQEEDEKEPIKEGIENDEKRKRKRYFEFEHGELMTKVGRTTSVVVVVLSTIVLGIYVKNLIAPVGNYEN